MALLKTVAAGTELILRTERESISIMIANIDQYRGSKQVSLRIEAPGSVAINTVEKKIVVVGNAI